MRYHWNPAKAAANLAKHGVAFEAVERFEWETALVEADLRLEEVRLIALGMIEIRLHVLIYTIETRAVRVISLRRANAKEGRKYAGA